MSTGEDIEDSCDEEDEEDFVSDGNSDIGGNLDGRYNEFVTRIEKAGFKWLNTGGFRRVYERNGVVIKVPHVGDGIVDNRVEAAVWRKYKNAPTDLGVYLAPCRLLPNGCLMMRKIDHWRWDTLGEKPDWSRNIDSCQIGLYNGKPVAYDYALDVTERAYLEDEWGHHSTFFQREWLDRKPHLAKKNKAA